MTFASGYRLTHVCTEPVLLQDKTEFSKKHLNELSRDQLKPKSIRILFFGKQIFILKVNFNILGLNRDS